MPNVQHPQNPIVTMVCTGNICRSAMADILLKDAAKNAGQQVSVNSCGVSNEEAGNPIDYRAADTLKRAGYQVPAHTARQISREDLENADLLLAMTSGHYARLHQLARKYGTDASKIRLYRQFEPGGNPEYAGPEAPRGLEVPDPWYGGMEDFQITLETIENCTPQILEYLRS
ncbi:hypothetical protein BSR28_01935 [Boudabousia liubingyangii]|uniref:low molecular weight protein-tyrosine-phosphatase n=1 Tax=Boudabousia liubingyangii TaxID=1921764 RepID=UPI00093B85C6|nr:low molecular weight protein-tyrosine-phosphatase [Boudabousia liubingyangii]OKL48480.1 hypothetical protein BSR28_01935 [Boudabousia liubingyangii]